MPGKNAANPNIKYVFVLMMENRSFDHMLGFSGITGFDAISRKPTAIDGLKDEINYYKGALYHVRMPADNIMPFDPGHEFTDVVEQLCGYRVTYPYGGPYPPINNGGFVANYATTKSPDEGGATSNFGEIMKCYAPAVDLKGPQLPVMTKLATEFAVCDSWFSSLPGPTWPNRFFVHAASSGGLDHSPTSAEIIDWEENPWSGFVFPNGTIYDLLTAKPINWRIYAGAPYPVSGAIPNVTALYGVSYWNDTYSFSEFASDLNNNYPSQYTFIEPNYGDVYDETYSGGQSQHPMDDVQNGERFIKQVYEAIRNSTIWEQSMLIITYDEHGGFYDHVAPQKAVPPGDNPGNTYNQHGFTFDQYGVRVPALVISAYTPKNTIDHRVYDHSSVPATLSAIFNLPNFLTNRDTNALNVTSLASLPNARTDTPTVLPEPGTLSPEEIAAARAQQPAFDPEESVDQGNLPGFLHLVVKAEFERAATDEERALIIQRAKQIKTKGQAKAYMEETIPKLQAAKRS